MTTKQEILFWQKAKKLARDGYVKGYCSEINLDCKSCQARLTISWIDNHIALLKWSLKE